jgi:hypothetical protein
VTTAVVKFDLRVFAVVSCLTLEYCCHELFQLVTTAVVKFDLRVFAVVNCLTLEYSCHELF